MRDSVASGTGAAVRNVLVEVIGKPGVITSTRTDADGRFTLSDVGGRFDLRVSRAGYRTATITVGPITANAVKDVAIEPIVRTVSGRVVEPPPSQTKGVAGARVEIVSGAHAGFVTTTNGSGNYTLSDVWGDVQVSISAGNYATTVQAVSIGDTDAVADVQLAPEPKVITETFGLMYFNRVWTRTFDVHYDGEFALTDLSFQETEWADMCYVDLIDGDRRIASVPVPGSLSRHTIALRVPVLAGHRYQLVLSTTSGTVYDLSFRHPS